jgi:hypothetical protein
MSSSNIKDFVFQDGKDEEFENVTIYHKPTPEQMKTRVTFVNEGEEIEPELPRSPPSSPVRNISISPKKTFPSPKKFSPPSSPVKVASPKANATINGVKLPERREYTKIPMKSMFAVAEKKQMKPNAEKLITPKKKPAPEPEPEEEVQGDPETQGDYEVQGDEIDPESELPEEEAEYVEEENGEPEVLPEESEWVEEETQAPVPETKSVPGFGLPEKDEMEEKMLYLYKQFELKKKGVKLPKEFTYKSNLMEMKACIDVHEKYQEKMECVQGWGESIVSVSSGVEKLVEWTIAKNNPEKNINGLSNHYQMQMASEFDPILGRIYDKYGKGPSMNPIAELALALGKSAVTFWGVKQLFNDELIKEFYAEHPEEAQKVAMEMQQQGKSVIPASATEHDPVPKMSVPPRHVAQMEEPQGTIVPNEPTAEELEEEYQQTVGQTGDVPDFFGDTNYQEQPRKISISATKGTLNTIIAPEPTTDDDNMSVSSKTSQGKKKTGRKKKSGRTLKL